MKSPVADGLRVSLAIEHRNAVGTRRLSSDLCRSTAIKTIVDGVPLLGPRILEHLMAGQPL